MPDKCIRYLLGIDGGGTKTEFLLTDVNKNVLGRTILSSSNPVNIGLSAAETLLATGINSVCEDKDYGEISVYAGLAGGNAAHIKDEIFSFLNGFGFGVADNGSDIDSTLELALKGENGIAVIMGTGIVAISQCNGKRKRIGGWGYFIDKGGSGFHYGADALRSAFSYSDGSGGSRLIAEMVENKLQKRLEDSISDIYSKGASFVASFAPVIFNAFNSGDDDAKRIIERNTEEAAKLIKNAHSLGGCKNNKIVICGGLCSQEDILKPYIHLFTENRFDIVFLNEPIVNGAVLLAQKNIKQGDRNA